MKHKVIFIVFFILYLIVCYFHFRWEKYYEKYFGDANDPYPVSKVENRSRIDNASADFRVVWLLDREVQQGRKF